MQRKKAQVLENDKEWVMVVVIVVLGLFNKLSRRRFLG